MDERMGDLLVAYVEEAKDHLNVIETSMLALEKEGHSAQLIDSMFRGIHSIKGAAGFFQLNTLVHLTHHMEELLSAAREGFELNEEVLNLIFECMDVLHDMFIDIQNSGDFEVEGLVQQLLKIMSKTADTSSEETPKEVGPDDTVDLSHLVVNNKPQIEALVKQGLLAFSVKIYPKKDILDCSLTISEFIEQAMSMGEIIQVEPPSFLDNPDKKYDSKQEILLLYCTVMELELVPLALQLPENQIASIDINEFTPAIKLPISLNETKEQDPSTFNVSQTSSSGEETLRVKVSQLNKLVDNIGELILSRKQVTQALEPYMEEYPNLVPIVKNINGVVSDLQEQIMNARMQPIGTIFSKFPRLIRDLSRQLKKSIELQTQGDEIELDKTVIEALCDPLTHLIRNSIDHGLESPDERQHNGKSTTSTILLNAFHQSGQVILEVRDDGRGIDPEKVSSIALNKKICTQQQVQQMSPKDIIRLVFSPSFTTSKVVSDGSEPDVGMSHIKNSIEKIGGRVDISSNLGLGTCVKLTLPLTLAIVSSLLVKVDQHSFILPQVNITELVNISANDKKCRIEVIQNKNILKIRDTLLPLLSLGELLELKDYQYNMFDKDKSLQVVIIEVDGIRLGLVVDLVIGIEEVVVKPIPQYLIGIDIYSGTTILGNGEVALILDLSVIAKSQTEESQVQTISTDHLKQISEPENLSTSYLIFDNGSDENFAIPVSYIKRIDHYESSKVQKVGTKSFLEVQGKILPLIQLDSCLEIQNPSHLEPQKAKVLIIDHNSHHFCLLIHNIIDSKSIDTDLDPSNVQTNLFEGSMLLHNKLTLFLNIPELINTFNGSLR